MGPRRLAPLAAFTATFALACGSASAAVPVNTVQPKTTGTPQVSNTLTRTLAIVAV